MENLLDKKSKERFEIKKTDYYFQSQITGREGILNRIKMQSNCYFFNKFYYYNLVMSQNEQKTAVKGENKQTKEEQSSDLQFYNYSFEQNEYEGEFELQEQYLSRLKIQRKRIQELSLQHRNYEERLENEVQKNKSLREQIERLSSAKNYQSRYNETIVNLQAVNQQNKSLREQIEELKQELYQASNEKTNHLQKLRLEVSLLRDKQSSKIQSLQQELSNKQEEIDKLQREIRLKQKEIQDLSSNLRSKSSIFQSEKEELIRIQQRKVERLERQLMSKNQTYSQVQSNTEALLKQNAQIKQENYRLNGILNAKELQLRSQAEKFKMKFNSMKKQLKNKERDYFEAKQSLRKYEKEYKQSSSESEYLKVQIKRLKQTIELQKFKLQSDFSKQKQSLQAIITQHTRTIEQLLSIKNDLLAQNKKLHAILQRKKVVQNKRKSYLKTQMKQIDRLQKVIDKIVD